MLLGFIVLQVMDLLTTLLFLHQGVQEGNPLMRAVLGAGRPEVGLALAKAAGIGLAIFAWQSGRRGLLGKLNLLFAACVVWNLIAAWVGRAS